MIAELVSAAATIVTEEFWELQKLYDMGRGTYIEFANAREARVAFAQTMRTRGYRLNANRVWLKAGFAAVMEPR